jgi:hypothetical protein
VVVRKWSCRTIDPSINLSMMVEVSSSLPKNDQEGEPITSRVIDQCRVLTKRSVKTGRTQYDLYCTVHSCVTRGSALQKGRLLFCLRQSHESTAVVISLHSSSTARLLSTEMGRFKSKGLEYLSYYMIRTITCTTIVRS